MVSTIWDSAVRPRRTLLQAKHPTEAPAPELVSSSFTPSEDAGWDRPVLPASRIPSLYRSHPIQVLPVANLDPEGRYQNQMEVYLPRRTTEPQNAEKMLPWKLEAESSLSSR